MMISTKGRYALRIMIDIAQNEGEAPVSLSDVAKRQGLSIKYIESIIAMLNKAGFVESYRGKAGGYKLSRAPEDYTVQQILVITEGTLAPVMCLDGSCERSQDCITLPLWKNLDGLIEKYLGAISLRDLLDGKFPNI